MEGVTKFRSSHFVSPLDESSRHAFAELVGWRDLLFRAGLIGIDSDRYGGVGFGNVSHRVGEATFLVSGTQTSVHPRARLEHFTLVESWELATNSVSSRGPAPPSSESMTHAMIYECRPDVVCVLHVHSPEIWAETSRLGLVETPEDADYGTPEMAAAVQQLRADGALQAGVFVMRGHEDGIVAFGASAREAAHRLLDIFAHALSLKV